MSPSTCPTHPPRPRSPRVPWRWIAALVVAVCALTACDTSAPADGGGPTDPVRDALAERAVPTTDLSAVSRLVGDARVVGVGEASHSAHEAFRFRRELFEHLVEDEGFRTFALEVSWSTGLLIDDHVVHGRGDLEEVMHRELQGQYAFWDTDEYRDLFTWMRTWNEGHADDPVRFVGTDLGFPGAAVFDRLGEEVARTAPARTTEVGRLASPLRPATGTQAGPWMAGRLVTDPAERRRDRDRARRLLGVVEEFSPIGSLAVQHARAIEQSFTGYAFEDDRFPDRMAYRDRVLAANLLWWQRHHGGRTVLATSNTHVGYASEDPTTYPVPAGVHLRRALGDAYVAVGMTFGRGRVNAMPEPTGPPGAADEHRSYDIGSPTPGSNEALLERVGQQDFVVDLRGLGGAAADGVASARPTRSYGLYWSDDAGHPVSLSRSYDGVVHLHQVSPGRVR